MPPLVAETIVVRALATELAVIHAALGRFLATLGATTGQRLSEEWRLELTTGVAEVATNVIRHAYPADSTPGLMELRLRGYADHVVACLVDRGIAYVKAPGHSAPPGPAVTDLPEGGYGLAIVRACVEELDYSRSADGINCWRLEKRF